MATNIAANSVVKYTIEGMLDNQTTFNIFHLQNKAATTLEALEDYLNNNLLGQFFDELSNEYQCTRVAVQSLWPVLTDPYEEAKAFSGSDAFAALPVANAAVISMKSGLGGRTKRGRKYLAGIPAQKVDDSRLTEAMRLGLQLEWDGMNGKFKEGGTGEAIWGILSSKPAGATPLERFTPVNSVIVRPILGTMRSRLPGHGR